jgi:hypothetical protein
MDVFREHGEEAAHEELRYALRVVSCGFELPCDVGDLRSDLTRDPRGTPGRVERVRVDKKIAKYAISA